MTQKQVRDYNYMLVTLKRIAKAYQTPAQIIKGAEKDYGLSPEEVLEMAYENIQAEAKNAIKGVRAITLPSKPTT